LGLLEVLVELFFRALCSHTLRERLYSSFRPKGFYKTKSVAETRDGGFSEETEDLLWRSEKSLQQGPLVCFTVFLWVHHVHKLLGSSLEVLQLLLPLLLLFAQCLNLLKAVGELLFGVGDHLLQPLDVICAVIQHILHVSKQLFFTR
jgi:hypothetical protein